jgi:hypothetical protein
MFSWQVDVVRHTEYRFQTAAEVEMRDALVVVGLEIGERSEGESKVGSREEGEGESVDEEDDMDLSD